MDNYKNKLVCPKCGTAILTEAKDRNCYKCDAKMDFIEVVRK